MRLLINLLHLSPPRRRSTWICALLLLPAAIFITVSVHAKETPIDAIVLFDGPSGPAYVRVTGLTLNGKGELRICDGIPKIGKSAYDALPRTQLAGATSLERVGDGTLMLTVNSKSVCVVPSGLKFEKSVEFTPAEAADQTTMQGAVVSSSIQGAALPPLKRGTRLMFVASADDELAQYLLAERTNSVPGWKDFLDRHATSARASDARNALAALHEQSAESAFAVYEKSSGQAADFTALKRAQDEAVQATGVVPGYAPAMKLRGRIHQELDSQLQPDNTRLQNFHLALAEHTAGYVQLAAAQHHTEDLLAVDSGYAPVIHLHSEVMAEIHKLESAIQQAQGLITSGNHDGAVQALGPYIYFKRESPRIAAVVSDVYSFHFRRGRELAAAHEWEKAVAEFQSASEIDNTSQEAISELKNAESGLASARDREAAQQAADKSRQYVDNKDFIAAYEVLVELPDRQRSFVSDQIASLQEDFVPAAIRRAQKLQDLHIPIRGRADEDAIQEAYDLLNRAAGINGDPAVKLKLDLLSDKIGVYYVDRAQRYLAKPLGSGVGIGWLYLGEAQRYRPNLSAVKDAMAQYAPAYQLRSRLSVGVILRDQTSRRDSPGFADQLTDAIAGGLESSGLSVKVIRQPKEGSDAIQPDFLLVGQILEHRMVKDANLETLPSKYRAGTHDVRNEEWTKANDAFAAAQKALQSAQQGLAAAHNKKDAAAAGDAVAAAQKNLDEARHKLDATEATRPQAVIETYNYTRKNIELTATIDLAFQLSDAGGNLLEPAVPIKKENQKHFVILENVKPEDTEGVKSQGTAPDEAQFLTDAEIQVRDALVKAVREKALLLPAKVLEAARSKAQQNDVDGAAEQYIVYLNAMPDKASPERAEATKFLRDHYNVTVAAAGR